MEDREKKEGTGRRMTMRRWPRSSGDRSRPREEGDFRKIGQSLMEKESRKKTKAGESADREREKGSEAIANLRRAALRRKDRRGSEGKE